MQHFKRTLVVYAFLGAFLSGCASVSSYAKNASLNVNENVELTICGESSTHKALEETIIGFNKIYPNCHISYEYVMNYQTSLSKRLAANDDVDCFITSTISSTSPYLPYTDDFKTETSLDLSNTFSGLMENSSAATGDSNKLYFIPFGGEIRGMFVNTTLLSAKGISIPTNYAEFLNACAALAGSDAKTAPSLIPLQGNPGNFALNAFYPYLCNQVANGEDPDALRAKINKAEDGSEEIFREPLERLYHLLESYYYNYDLAETRFNNFTDGSTSTACYSFLNIHKDAAGNYVKTDDIGNVPFFPWVHSIDESLKRCKEDFQSAIDYRFILSPFGDDGGYGYLSPSSWIALNKASKNKAWALEFLNYLFSKEGNPIFANAANIIPNTKDALEVVKNSFNVPLNHVSQVGQVSYSWDVYSVLKASLTEISKANKAKYMVDNGDGTYTMHPFSYYLGNLKAAFAAQKAKLG
jgi:ABC-type sugar transport system, periplasmic component